MVGVRMQSTEGYSLEEEVFIKVNLPSSVAELAGFAWTTLLLRGKVRGRFEPRIVFDKKSRLRFDCLCSITIVARSLRFVC